MKADIHPDYHEINQCRYDRRNGIHNTQHAMVKKVM